MDSNINRDQHLPNLVNPQNLTSEELESLMVKIDTLNQRKTTAQALVLGNTDRFKKLV